MLLDYRPLLEDFIDGEGIPSGEDFGQPSLTVVLTPQGIASAEAFGLAALTQELSPGLIVVRACVQDLLVYQDPIIIVSWCHEGVVFTSPSHLTVTQGVVRLVQVEDEAVVEVDTPRTIIVSS